MKLMICSVLAAALFALAACAPPPPHAETLPRSGQLATPASAGDRISALEARVAQLEADRAQNAEALEFLRKVYDQQKAQQQEQERDELADDGMFAVDIAESVKAGQVEGPANAPVTIVKAFDFACPFCYRSVATEDALLKDYRGKIRVVYMNLVVHPPARTAHLASCAAARQGKYNEFARAFWDKGFAPYADSHDPAKLDEEHVLAIAKGVGLDTTKLKADMDSPACAARIEADTTELSKFRVHATPTFFINGKPVAGAIPKEAFAQIIDEQLKAVAASGVPGSAYYQKVVLGKGEKQFRSKLDPKPH